MGELKGSPGFVVTGSSNPVRLTTLRFEPKGGDHPKFRRITTMNTQLSFHDVKFNLVNHNNQIWFTSAELASALQYSNIRAVSGVYNRHKDEFTDSMTLVLKLNTKGFGGGNSAKDTRVFSLRGAHLIGMMSDTPVAKEFRKWVLDILDREVGNTQPVITPVKPEYKTYTITLTEQELSDLCWLWKVADNMRKGAEAMHPGLKALGSEFSGRCYDIAFESRYTLENVKDILRRETKGIDSTAYRWKYILPQIHQTKH
ncbi:hypothetical protein AAFQ48_004388 [Yersinia enterocolitica]